MFVFCRIKATNRARLAADGTTLVPHFRLETVKCGERQRWGVNMATSTWQPRKPHMRQPAQVTMSRCARLCVQQQVNQRHSASGMSAVHTECKILEARKPMHPPTSRVSGL